MGDALVREVNEAVEYLIQHFSLSTNDLRRLEDVKSLNDMSRIIQGRLNDAEEMHTISETSRLCLKELKKSFYHAEDVLDEFLYYVLHLKWEGTTSPVDGNVVRADAGMDQECDPRSSTNPHGNLAFMDDLVETIRELKVRLDKEKMDWDALALGLPRIYLQRPTTLRPQSTSLMGSTSPIGRYKDLQEIEDLLFSELDGDVNIPAIAILGMGGLGKTTLAQLVYNHIQVPEEFDLKIWVCVSQDFDLPKLTKAMVESLEDGACDLTQMGAFQRRLKGIVESKRLLVVFDDIWEHRNLNPDAWKDLCRPLLGVSHGSKIIVTTRSRRVLDRVIMPASVYQLPYLTNDDCFMVFSQHAFKDWSDIDPTLLDIGKKISNKCRGIPLAAKTLGSLLRRLDGEKQWKDILNYIGIWDSDDEDPIMPILQLSYQYLPTKLKKCFRYCSVFPKAHRFNKEKLINMWIAHGYITQTERGKKQLEELGVEYINELVSRSLLEQFEDFEIVKMHNLIHDLARYVSQGEWWSVEDGVFYGSHDDSAQHLSVISTKNYPQEHVRWQPQVRCLLFFNSILRWFDTKDLCSRMKQLRILDMSYTGIFNLPDCISDLKHLRYLSLEGNKITDLPETLGNLYLLETLNLNYTRIECLPNWICFLKGLRYLGLRSTCIKYLPESLGMLDQLYTLDVEFCELSSLPDNISNLSNLRRLICDKDVVFLQKSSPIFVEGIITDTEVNEGVEYLRQCFRISANDQKCLEDVKSLSEVSQIIRAELNNAEEMEITSDSARLCLTNLKKSLYDAEAVLDEFLYHVLHLKLEGAARPVDGNVVRTDASMVDQEPDPSSSTNSNEDLVFMNALVVKITNSKVTLYKKRRDWDSHTFGLPRIYQQQLTFYCPPSTAVMGSASPIGRDVQLKEIKSLLLSKIQGDEDIPIIVIMGLGGLGKTTLARFVYNDPQVQEHFSLGIWVSVSEDFDVVRLTRAMVESLEHKKCDLSQMDPLQRRLKEIVDGERILIVFDDVWEQKNLTCNVWEDLCRPLLGVSDGSKILVTTRSKQVSNEVIMAASVYELPRMTNDDCFRLFSHHAFKDWTCDIDPILLDIGKEISNKCRGLPLAAKTLGSLLRGQDDVEVWNDIVNSSGIWYSDDENPIMAILWLSYKHLPTRLRNCLRYCSVFPKDYQFHKDQLINLWTAHGYITRMKQREKELEDIGEEYINELVSRSLFEQFENQEIFMIHGLIHDLAREVSHDEWWIVDDGVCYGNQVDSVEHFSVISTLYYPQKHIQKQPQVRCLLFFNSMLRSHDLKDLCSRMTQLRVLDMSYTGILNLPECISDLKHLRYLSLHGNQITELPESVGMLYLLETLNLNYTRIECLPGWICFLKRLRYLGLRSTCIRDLPESLGMLDQLHTLDVEFCKISSLPDSILNLSSLRRLIYDKDVIFPQRFSSFLLDGTVAGTEVNESVEYLRRRFSLSANDLRRLEDMKSLNKKFQKVRALLNDAEEMKIANETATLCLKNLKKVFYDAEDVLDEFLYHVLHLKSVDDNVVLGDASMVDLECYLSSSTSLQVNLVFMDDLVQKVTDLKVKLDNEKMDWVPHAERLCSGYQQKPTIVRAQSTSLIGSIPLIGRGDDLQEIKHLLFSKLNGRGNIPVIAIVGQGGLGKTALAQYVYNDPQVQQHFYPKIWACVSVDFDLVRLTRAMLEDLKKKSYDLTELDELQIKLDKAVKGKRLLLVFDDVWDNPNLDKNTWEALCRPLRGVSEGSRIVVTTSKKVSNEVIMAARVYELPYLTNDDCFILFSQHAFKGLVSDMDPILLDIGRKISNKCGGLPLAAKTLGSLLCGQYDVEEWNDLLNNIGIWDSDDQNPIMPILRLSYHYLPTNLKKCFRYCSVFPKDYESSREELINMWMALGYITRTEQKEKQLEDIGEDYINELVSRSLFEQSINAYNFEVFMMHDLINDLARDVSQGEWSSVEGGMFYDNQDDSVLHLSVFSARNHRQENARQQQKFRCLLFFNSTLEGSHINDLCSGMKRLRVLDLTRTGLKNLPNCISDLKHLRYLCLEGNYIKELPESVGSLYLLETLNLNHTGIEVLPDSICFLKRLRYLSLRDAWIENPPKSLGMLDQLHTLDVEYAYCCLPDSIAKLSSLRRLFCEHDFVLPSAIRKLTDLYTFTHFQNRRHVLVKEFTGLASVDEAKKLSSYSKEHLEVLSLVWNDSPSSTAHQRHGEVLESLGGHPKLKQLYMQGFAGSSLPSWLTYPCYLPKLNRIDLISCEQLTSLPPLENFRRLKHVHIESAKILQDIGHVDCPNVSSFSLDGFGYPLDLKIIRCPQLHLPCLGGLTRLQNLSIIDCDQDIPIEFSSGGFLLLESLELEDLPNWRSWAGPQEGECRNLRKLSIVGCSSLENFSISCLHRLKDIHVKNCPMLKISRYDSEKLHDMEKYCKINICEIKIISHGYDALDAMEQSQRLPPDLHLWNLSAVGHLVINQCDMLESISSEELPSSLKSIQVDACRNMRHLHLGNQHALQYLSIENCNKLSQVECISSILRFLEIHSSRKSSLLRILNLSNVDTKIHSSCELVFCHPGHLSNVEYLSIRNCVFEFSCVPQLSSTLKVMKIDQSILKLLDIVKCSDLTSFPLHWLEGLEELGIIRCSGPTTFVDVKLLPSTLKKLDIVECSDLTSFPLYSLGGLEELRIIRCSAFASLANMKWLPSTLKTLEIVECFDLTSFSLHLLESLEELRIIACSGPAAFTDVKWLPSTLRVLEIDAFQGYSSSFKLYDPSSLSQTHNEELYLPLDRLNGLECLKLKDSLQLCFSNEKSLPSTLEVLCIIGCPKLEDWCQRHSQRLMDIRLLR